MSRYDARKALNKAPRLRPVGPGHMQVNYAGCYVRAEDYGKAVRKAAEEQRAAQAAGKLVGALYRLIQDLGSTKMEMEARKLLGKE